MKRRDFLKLSLAACCSHLLPEISLAASPLDSVRFSASVYGANQPQTIMIFLYGGASELAGNFTNYDQFKDLSLSSYPDHFGSGRLNATGNGFWASAGGTIMEELLVAGKLNVFRTCFSERRWQENNRSHGSCVAQNQRGSFDENRAGIFANLARVLKSNGIVDADSKMPFLSMEGDTGFFALGDLRRDSILEPLSINENLDNPYHRESEPSFTDAMDELAQQINRPGKIRDAFKKRREMEEFIDEIDALPDPALSEEDAYENNSFARKLKTAVKILCHNDDTRVITLGTSGLGGWDDHNNAEDYLSRMEHLFLALRSAMLHIDLKGRRDRVNIMVMGDFGRGVNLNSANGWDHGNLQTLYVLGGTGYFRTPGVVGETVVDNTGSVNRLYLRPRSSSYWFEPSGVAASIYKAYGILNPEILTDGVAPITPLIS